MVKSQATDVIDDQYARILEEISDRIQAGETIDLRDYKVKYMDYAEQLEQLLPAMQVLIGFGRDIDNEDHGCPVSASPHTDPESRKLGDFRIVREVGRGGMGVVYEAEQISLGRRVALKVLPFAGILDQRQLRRFKNEAHAAAGLHHQNIVPVHAVGSDRGVHFFAMQYVDGQTLDTVIHDLRRRSDQLPAGIAASSHRRADPDLHRQMVSAKDRPLDYSPSPPSETVRADADPTTINIPASAGRSAS